MFPLCLGFAGHLTSGRAKDLRPAAKNVLVTDEALRFLYRINGNFFAVFAHTFIVDGTIDEGIEGIVRADADVIAGMDVGTALAVEDVAGEDELAVGALAAEALRHTVTAVFGGTHSLFMGEKL